MSVFIGNLPYEVGHDDLKQVFAEYGTVKSIRLPTDRETGRMRGFAFVEMETEEEETAAIEALDGAEWVGRSLKVSKAKPRQERERRSPMGGGGDRGGNYKRDNRRD